MQFSIGLPTDHVRHHENSRGVIIFPKYGQGIGDEILVSIVESDDHRTSWKVGVATNRYRPLVEHDGMITVATQLAQLISKVVGRDAVGPVLSRPVMRNAVVH